MQALGDLYTQWGRADSTRFEKAFEVLEEALGIVISPRKKALTTRTDGSPVTVAETEDLPPPQETRARVLTALGEAHWCKGNLTTGIGDDEREKTALAALTRFQEALQIHRQLDTETESPGWAPKYTLTASVLLKIAQCDQSLGNLDEALSNVNEALDLRRAVFGDESVPVAIAHGRIGALWRRKLKALKTVGKPGIHAQMLTIKERIINSFREEVRILVKMHGVKSDNTATAFYNLGMALLSEGFCQHSEAKEGVDMIAKAIRIHRRVVGDDNPAAQIYSQSLAEAQTILSQLGDKSTQGGRESGASMGSDPPPTHVSAPRATTAAASEVQDTGPGPSHGAVFVAGEYVEIHSLKATPQHNGSRAKLLSFNPHKGRWALELCGQRRGKLEVKSSNLKRLPASAHTWQPSDEAEMNAIKSRGAGQEVWTARVSSEVCLNWVHARMSCGCKSIMDGVSPLFPGPPLWITDVQDLNNSISTSNNVESLTNSISTSSRAFFLDLMSSPDFPGQVAAYTQQCEADEVYLAKRDFACEKCGKPCPKPHISPRCRCGEAYCSREVCVRFR